MAEPSDNTAQTELALALAKCRETHVGNGPCFNRDYLAARSEYHALLVKHGMLDPRLAERERLAI